jgi:hypothetical protein
LVAVLAVILAVSYRLGRVGGRKESVELGNESPRLLQASDDYDLDGTPLGGWQRTVANGLVGWLNAMRAPVGFGIFGGWGVGKTGLMMALEAELATVSTFLIRVTAASLRSSDSEDAVLKSLADQLKNNHSQGVSGSCYILIDEIDKASPVTISSIISAVARFQVEPEIFHAVEIPRQTYFVLAGNLQRILEKLSKTAGGMEDADEVVACAVAQRFYPTSANPDVAVASFWPIASENDSGVSDEMQVDIGEDSVVNNIGFLLRYSRHLSTSNLRHLRQTITSLSYFSRTYATSPFKKLCDEERFSRFTDELLWNICQFALAILVRVRMEYPEVYVEWTSRIDNIDVIVEGLSALEIEFSNARAGTMPTVDDSRGVQRAAQIFGGAGFDLTRELLQESGKSAFLRFYRDIRRQLIRAIASMPKKDEIDLIFIRNKIDGKYERVKKYNRLLLGRTELTSDESAEDKQAATGGGLPVADSLEEYFGGLYNKAVSEYWKEFLRQ